MLGALVMLTGITIIAWTVVLLDQRARRADREKRADSAARQRSG